MRKRKWTLEKLQEEALKYRVKGDFIKYSWTAYQTANTMGCLDQVCSHMTTKHIVRSTKDLHKEALKYKTRGEFQKQAPNPYTVALRRGILDQICSHMELARREWTNEELAEEALRYRYRSVFERKNRKAYDVAIKRGILDQICGHMEYLVHQWADEELVQEALKYNTRSEFRKNSKAYDAARVRGILNSICSHMKRSGGISLAEQELFDTIKKSFDRIKKIRDSKVKIQNKPYIKGFDIDMFVPELNKGIEFDGEYYHSFDYMRNDPKKIKWSDDDIRNYHELKDQWFLTKGIKILHIKEEEWVCDKTSCIQKCLKFLGVKNA